MVVSLNDDPGKSGHHFSQNTSAFAWSARMMMEGPLAGPQG